MDILITVIAILFFLYPTFINKKISFVDVYLIFCLLYDVIFGLISPQAGFIQYIFIALYSLYYFFFQYKNVSKYDLIILFSSLTFLFSMFTTSLINGLMIKSALINLLTNNSSIIILPIAFHYYSYKGNITNLIYSVYLFIILWSSIVVLYTLLRIDINANMFGSLNEGSQAFGGGILFFGSMGRRGSPVYISFLLLLVPLVYRYINPNKKIAILAYSGFLLSLILISVKRLSYLIIIIGYLNYFFNSGISFIRKISIAIGTVLMVIVILTSTNVSDIAKESYEKRGGNSLIEEKTLTNDIRLLEIPYVVSDLLESSKSNLLIGIESNNSIKLKTEEYAHRNWTIHNQYAEYLYRYGLITTILYLFLLFYLFSISVKFKNKLFKLHVKVTEYWIVLQNFILIFLIAGFMGMHIYTTYRGLVFIFAGAISGYFLKLLRQEKQSISS